MEILSKVTTQVVETVYTFQDETSVFYYKEWLDDRGKVIDEMLMDKDGYQIDDPVLWEQVQEFVAMMDEEV